VDVEPAVAAGDRSGGAVCPAVRVSRRRRPEAVENLLRARAERDSEVQDPVVERGLLWGGGGGFRRPPRGRVTEAGGGVQQAGGQEQTPDERRRQRCEPPGAATCVAGCLVERQRPRDCNSAVNLYPARGRAPAGAWPRDRRRAREDRAAPAFANDTRDD